MLDLLAALSHPNVEMTTRTIAIERYVVQSRGMITPRTLRPRLVTRRRLLQSFSSAARGAGDRDVALRQPLRNAAGVRMAAWDHTPHAIDAQQLRRSFPPRRTATAYTGRRSKHAIDG